MFSTGQAGAASSVRSHLRSVSAAKEICREVLASVSPPHLVRESVRVVEGERDTHVMRVGDRDYQLNQ